MKFVLASAGFYTKEIAEATARMAGKSLAELNVAVINEASAVEQGDKTWLFDEFARLRTFVGGEIDFINLLALKSAEVEARIDRADAVYVAGGNTDYLMSVFQKTGFDQIIKNLAGTNKVYVGSSAGSMVIGRRYYDKDDFDVSSYLNCVNFGIKPHFNANSQKSKEYLERIVKNIDFKIYALMDTQAIMIDCDKVEYIRGLPLVLSSGKN